MSLLFSIRLFLLGLGLIVYFAEKLVQGVIGGAASDVSTVSGSSPQSNGLARIVHPCST